VDQPEVDQHLTVVRHRQVREYAAHQAVPVGDAARGVVALVTVGRRGEAQRRALAPHQRGDHLRVGGIATDQAVRADGPDIAGAGHRLRGRIRHVVGGVRLLSVRRCVIVGGSHLTREQRLDLGILKPGQSHVVPGFGQFRQFQRQHLLVPAGIKRQSVVGDDIGALLRRRQMGQFDHRHLIQSQLARSGQAAVAGDDAVRAIDKDRVGPAELDDAGRDLGDLALGVRARIAGVGDQRLDLAVLDVERVQRASPKAKPAERCRPAGWKMRKSGAGNRVRGW
jgi:hypothetical protein